jgi:hypothetical protein
MKSSMKTADSGANLLRLAVPADGQIVSEELLFLGMNRKAWVLLNDSLGRTRSRDWQTCLAPPVSNRRLLIRADVRSKSRSCDPFDLIFVKLTGATACGRGSAAVLVRWDHRTMRP